MLTPAGRAQSPDHALPAVAAQTSPPPTDLRTHVELFWVEGVKEHWLRFGQEVGDRIIDRRRRVVSFAPETVFAFVRWAANDYGTISSRIDIVRAVSSGEPYATVPHVAPGGDILLQQQGWPKVVQVLRAIDVIDALDIDPGVIAPDHWRHIHNRLSASIVPRKYSRERHYAWLSRKRLGR